MADSLPPKYGFKERAKKLCGDDECHCDEHCDCGACECRPCSCKPG